MHSKPQRRRVGAANPRRLRLRRRERASHRSRSVWATSRPQPGAAGDEDGALGLVIEFLVARRRGGSQFTQRHALAQGLATSRRPTAPSLLARSRPPVARAWPSGRDGHPGRASDDEVEAAAAGARAGPAPATAWLRRGSPAHPRRRRRRRRPCGRRRSAPCRARRDGLRRRRRGRARGVRRRRRGGGGGARRARGRSWA